MFGYFIFTLCYFHRIDDDNICNDVKICIKDSSVLKFINEQNINNILKKEKLSPIGSQMGKIDLTKIETAIERHPVVKNAECYRTANKCVCIDVYQRNPIFRVLSGKNNFYIDNDHEEMPIPQNFAADVPIVTGYINKTFVKNELYDFITYINDDDFWDAQIEQINIVPNNEIELVPRVGNYTIKLGSLDKFEEKLENMELFYEKGLNKVGWNKYKIINLKYKNQIVCTKY